MKHNQTFDGWWAEYSKPEYFNEPLDTLKYMDHDEPRFEEYIKAVAKVAWDAANERATIRWETSPREI